MRSTRWLALSALSLTLISGAAATTQQTLPIRHSSTYVLKQVQTTTLISEATVEVWNCQAKLVLLGVRKSQDKLSSPSPVAGEKYLKWVLKQRITKQATCLKKLHRIAYEWNWQAFPSWVISLARCESSVNWYAEGSSSDGVFYSAFNISRSVYDRDAHHMGVRGWNEGPGVPSPWEQAMAVIGHVRLYGDGFTGRCHGIARSTWN